MHVPANYEAYGVTPEVADLGGDAAEEAEAYLARDPVSHVFMLSWLENYGLSAPGRPELFGFRAVREHGRVVGLSLLITDRLALMAVDDARGARVLGKWHRERGAALDHIVSRRQAVAPFWGVYSQRVDVRARLVRDQELHVIERSDWLRAHAVSSRPADVTLARRADLDAIFWASARMHAEETLEDPLARDAVHFRRHVEHRIENGRTYAWFDEHRRLLFKADISAQSSWGAQISGVYTPPALRGQGVATTAVAAICDDLFERGFPRVTLYVNRTNEAARRVYQKVGFRYYTDYQTVFIEPVSR